MSTLIKCCSLNVDTLFLLAVSNSQQLLCSSNTFYLLVWWTEQCISNIPCNYNKQVTNTVKYTYIYNYQSRLLSDPTCDEVRVFLMHTQWLYVKLGDMTVPREMPRHLDRPLVAGCSTGHSSPRDAKVGRLDKNFRYTVTNVFPKMASVILDWISTHWCDLKWSVVW